MSTPHEGAEKRKLHNRINAQQVNIKGSHILTWLKNPTSYK